MNQDISSLSFSLANNVKISVIDKKRHICVKEVKVHNKATRNMVSGLLRFVIGNFNKTYKNDKTVAYPDDAKLYIPCFIGVGCGGIEMDPQTGYPVHDPENTRKPIVSEDWNTHVNYLSNSLEVELTGYGTRPPIESAETTVYKNNPLADMDTVIFRALIPPNSISGSFDWDQYSTSVFVSEIGLFPSAEIHEDKNEDRMLAHVKLAKDEMLYVRPQDTIEITWSISIVAVGRDATFKTEQASGTIYPNVGGGVTIITPENE